MICIIGYGLETETEMKMLKVIHSATSKAPIDIVSTFLAHSIPKGMTQIQMCDDIIKNQLPQLKVNIRLYHVHSVHALALL